jgi:hypothetical protein
MDGYGVYGYSEGIGVGVQGVSIDGPGVNGQSTNSYGI